MNDVMVMNIIIDSLADCVLPGGDYEWENIIKFMPWKIISNFRHLFFSQEMGYKII